MKKSLLALAVLSAISGVASAQSSVTLSGILDAGVIRKGAIVAGAPVYDWSLGGSGSAFNAFTLSGREDLGGGSWAFFTMNHRFRIQNGTINSADFGTGTGGASSPTFYRNIFVGLGGAFGDVRLGRMLMPLQELNGQYDIWYGGYTVASTHTGGLAATQRANNTIYYRSPNLSGLQVHAAIAAGEGQLQGETAGLSLGGNAAAPATGGKGQRPAGFAIQYSAGPLSLAAAYDRNYSDNKTKGIYGRYNFGFAIVNFQYEDGEQTLISALPLEKMKAFSISADIPLGAVTGKVGYLRANSNSNRCNASSLVAANGTTATATGTAACDAHKFGVGGEYNFSKRTLVYADVAKVSGDRVNTAVQKSQFDIGLRHRF